MGGMFTFCSWISSSGCPSRSSLRCLAWSDEKDKDLLRKNSENVTTLQSKAQSGAQQKVSTRKKEKNKKWKKRAVSAKSVVNTFKEKHKAGKILQQFF